MILAGHVAGMGIGKAYTGFWWGNLRERDHSVVPSVEGRIILSWIFTKKDEVYGLDRTGSGQGQVAGTCECGNKPSGFLTSSEPVNFSKRDPVPLRI